MFSKLSTFGLSCLWFYWCHLMFPIAWKHSDLMHQQQQWCWGDLHWRLSLHTHTNTSWTESKKSQSGGSDGRMHQTKRRHGSYFSLPSTSSCLSPTHTRQNEEILPWETDIVGFPCQYALTGRIQEGILDLTEPTLKKYKCLFLYLSYLASLTNRTNFTEKERRVERSYAKS